MKDRLICQPAADQLPVAAGHRQAGGPLAWAADLDARGLLYLPPKALTQPTRAEIPRGAAVVVQAAPGRRDEGHHAAAVVGSAELPGGQPRASGVAVRPVAIEAVKPGADRRKGPTPAVILARKVESAPEL